jgi:hypothetical protein
MRDYKGWTAKERLASLRKTKAAIAEGIIPNLQNVIVAARRLGELTITTMITPTQ